MSLFQNSGMRLHKNQACCIQPFPPQTKINVEKGFLMKDQFVTTTKAAQLCHVSRFTVRNWANRNMLTTVKTAGGHRRILLDDLNRFMDEKNISMSIGQRNGRGNGNGNGHRIFESKSTPQLEFVKLNGTSGHDCTRWIMFREEESQCFMFVKNGGNGKAPCRPGCLTCESLKAYDVKGNKLMKNAQKILNNSLYKTGKSLGSVTSLFFKAEENDKQWVPKISAKRLQPPVPKKKNAREGILEKISHHSEKTIRAFQNIRPKKNKNGKHKRWPIQFGRGIR